MAMVDIAWEAGLHPFLASLTKIFRKVIRLERVLFHPGYRNVEGFAHPFLVYVIMPQCGVNYFPVFFQSQLAAAVELEIIGLMDKN